MSPRRIPALGLQPAAGLEAPPYGTFPAQPFDASNAVDVLLSWTPPPVRAEVSQKRHARQHALDVRAREALQDTSGGTDRNQRSASLDRSARWPVASAA